MLRISEAGLIVAIWAAVLGFGGTSPPFFLVSQVIIFGLGILLVSASLRTPFTTIGFPVAVHPAIPAAGDRPSLRRAALLGLACT